ncbi:hypothetical protein [Fructobacillus ficulneus]|uniref:Uncharacterized protein n=1 Tax=Fructobacillus ficulneus TaxID=157463 RepID=A0A0K8MGY6_9LACO|nr:hypothetical protein [Fructobacillus ficulneus]GAO99826.1 hypothetical protein FFIC_241010 [Fructobacillus ficulneus]
MQQIFKGMDNGASTIDANFKELTSTSYSPTVQDLTVNGQLVVNPNQTEKIAKFMDNSSKLMVEAHRMNNTVSVKFNGYVQGLSANNLMGTMPIGYRPSVETRFPVISVWSKFMMFVIKTDGTIMTTSLAEDDNTHGVEGSVIYQTKDSFPS